MAVDLPTSARRSTAIHILSTGVVLSVMLLVVRAQIVGFKGNWLAAGYYDFLLVASVTAVFLVLPARRAIVWSYRLAALLVLVAALLNVKIVAVLGKPFTYQWLYYSDFLRSRDAHQAISSGLSWKTGTLGALVVLALGAGAWLVGRGLAKVPGRRLFVGSTLLCVVYFPWANWELRRCHWEHGKLASPLVSFAESALIRRPAALFTMKTPFGPADYQIGSERPVTAAPAKPAAASPIRNVLFFVLESVPTEFLEAYGGVHPVTPELNRYRQQAVLFRNVYATAPSTSKSTVSMLCSVYPWISYQSVTSAHPDIDLPSLSSELRARDYRTAFFTSSDNNYLSLGRFLKQHGFDEVADFRTLACTRAKFADPSGNQSFLDGVDDECAADAFINWMNVAPDRPFLGMVWTMMTHYPYFVSGPETDYRVDDEYLNRYLNALKHGDYCFGKIMRALEARGLADSTLVVVVGDHGEAFGRHHQWTHATKIYEENVHVPLLLINRRLFHGEEVGTLGSMIDLPPTVMELLQLPPSPRWQGRSLFGADRPARVYFFATWSEFLFGYRDGDHKYIYNAIANQYEMYDLSRDPLETTNLASQSPDTVKTIAQRLAAWVQYQEALIQRSIQSTAHTRRRQSSEAAADVSSPRP